MRGATSKLGDISSSDSRGVSSFKLRGVSSSDSGGVSPSKLRGVSSLDSGGMSPSKLRGVSSLELMGVSLHEVGGSLSSLLIDPDTRWGFSCSLRNAPIGKKVVLLTESAVNRQ